MAKQHGLAAKKFLNRLGYHPYEAKEVWKQLVRDYPDACQIHWQNFQDWMNGDLQERLGHESVEIFTALAPIWNYTQGFTQPFDVRTFTFIEEQVERHVGQRAITLVDGGCGLGHLALYLASRHPNWLIIGYDRVPALIEYATKLANQLAVANVSFVVANHNDYLTDNQAVIDILLFHRAGATETPVPCCTAAFELISDEFPDFQIRLEREFCQLAGALTPNGLLIQIREANLYCLNFLVLTAKDAASLKELKRKQFRDTGDPFGPTAHQHYPLDDIWPSGIVYQKT